MRTDIIAFVGAVLLANPPDYDRPLTYNHLAPTGRVLPYPGASNSAGTTSIDRGIEQRDDLIDSSLCSGC